MPPTALPTTAPLVDPSLLEGEIDCNGVEEGAEDAAMVNVTSAVEDGRVENAAGVRGGSAVLGKAVPGPDPRF